MTLVLAAVVLGSDVGPGTPALAQPPPVLLAAGDASLLAQAPRRREVSEGTNWVPIVIAVAVVVGLVGLGVLIYMKQQGGGSRKPKVSETAESIGGYRLEKLLQQGISSQVWEVVETVSSRHFAMKVLLPEASKDPVQRQLLFNEADVGIELAHPNVIKIIKVFKEASTPCFVMEFFPSGSMRQRIQYRDWDFIKEKVHEILKQSATALAYMNSNGWLHRDIKPDNILVNSAGEVRLIDFAIAQRVPTGMAKWFRTKGKRAGTRSYMSPEAIRCQALDTRSDIYSFGATCYEIVTLRTPFKGASSDELLNKQLFEKPIPPQVHCPDLTDDFSKFILRMLAKKREERLANFHEVLMELRKIKIFKTATPAQPRDAGTLHLHPEVATQRRGGAKPPPPRAPGGGPAPKS
jgi:serine/threonine-protein kinase